MKPIIFSTEMVKAILREADPKRQTRRVITNKYAINAIHVDTRESQIISEFSKYQIGDILYVRETFARGTASDKQFFYKANDLTNGKGKTIKWKPSIFMPKEAARIFLKITNVRLERIEDISPQDCISEGISLEGQKYIRADMKARAMFFELWDSINKKRGYGRDNNPWVFVYDFERIEDDKTTKRN